MSIDAQASLFGEGLMTAPKASSTPDADTIRRRLHRLLGTLRAAETMPLTERDVRMWRTVVPNMTRWLPDAEAEAIRFEFVQELERLRALA